MSTEFDPIRRDLESLLEHDGQSLSGSELLSDIGWDSMAVVMLIALADQKYGAAVPPARIAACVTVDDLCAAILDSSSSGHAKK